MHVHLTVKASTQKTNPATYDMALHKILKAGYIRNSTDVTSSTYKWYRVAVQSKSRSGQAVGHRASGCEGCLFAGRRGSQRGLLALGGSRVVWDGLEKQRKCTPIHYIMCKRETQYKLHVYLL